MNDELTTACPAFSSSFITHHSSFPPNRRRRVPAGLPVGAGRSNLNNSSIMPCVSSATLVSRISQSERSKPVESKNSAGKHARMLAAMRAFSSGLGLSGLNTGWNAARNEANTNGQACRLPCKPRRHCQSSAKSRARWGSKANSLTPCMPARWPTNRSVQRSARRRSRFSFAAASTSMPGADHESQHAMPSLDMADQHAAATGSASSAPRQRS